MVPSRPECQTQEAQLVLEALQAQTHPKHHTTEKNESDSTAGDTIQNRLNMLDTM